MELQIAYSLLISLALGAAIGLEREVHENNDASPEASNQILLGVRSFALITSLGTIAALLYKDYLTLSLIISSAYIILLLLHYAFNSLHTKDIGITTELAAIFAFVIGQMIGLEVFPVQLIVAITVVVILILSYKDHIKGVTEDIQKHELLAFVRFAIIALVILPFLPNTSYSLGDVPQLKDFLKALNLQNGNIASTDLMNPFKTWLVVALITGIDVAGYILERIIGKNKGILLSSMVGGFISSTATTQSLAQQSNKSSNINSLVGAALLANFVSFFPTLFIISSINSKFFIQVLPIFISIILATLTSGVFFSLRISAKDKNEASPKGNSKIFALGPALKFAFMYLIIGIVSKIAVKLFGSNGFLIASGFGALTGIDAVTINTAELAGGLITLKTAVWAFVIINAVNLIGKTSYSFLQGKKEFALKFGGSVLGTILLSIIVAFLI